MPSTNTHQPTGRRAPEQPDRSASQGVNSNHLEWPDRSAGTRNIMAILGPMVVVAEKPATELVDTLGKAGAFPIIETKFADAAAAVTEIQPAALLIAEADASPDVRHLQALLKVIDKRGGPFMPV